MSSSEWGKQACWACCKLLLFQLQHQTNLWAQLVLLSSSQYNKVFGAAIEMLGSAMAGWQAGLAQVASCHGMVGWKL
jgi:hypothetical protein